MPNELATQTIWRANGRADLAPVPTGYYHPTTPTRMERRILQPERVPLRRTGAGGSFYGYAGHVGEIEPDDAQVMKELGLHAGSDYIVREGHIAFSMSGKQKIAQIARVCERAAVELEKLAHRAEAAMAIEPDPGRQAQLLEIVECASYEAQQARESSQALMSYVSIDDGLGAIQFFPAISVIVLASVALGTLGAVPSFKNALDRINVEAAKAGETFFRVLQIAIWGTAIWGGVYLYNNWISPTVEGSRRAVKGFREGYMEVRGRPPRRVGERKRKRALTSSAPSTPDIDESDQIAEDCLRDAMRAEGIRKLPSKGPFGKELRSAYWKCRNTRYRGKKIASADKAPELGSPAFAKAMQRVTGRTSWRRAFG